MATAQTAPATGTDTMNVYCKHGGGLVLRVGKFTEKQEGGHIHSRPVNEWQQTGTFTVAGPARRPGEDAVAPVIGGYAVTHGVPKDLWEQWLKDNKDSPLVLNRIIFAHAKTDHGDGQAKEQRGVRTGMEPLAQGKDPRAPGGGVEKMTSAEAA